MELKLIRKYKKQDYTIGQLYYNDQFLCNTLEDHDRGLHSNMSIEEIKKIKKPLLTAIPTGTYNITLDIVSPKFSKYPFYQEVCKGKLPRLQNVKGFDGILIHCGTRADNSSGCILVGLNKIKGGLVESKEIFKMLYQLLQDHKQEGLTITIE